MASMFCTNCGKEVNEGAAACLNCGFAPKAGTAYCESCGSQVNAKQVKCGVPTGSCVAGKFKLAAGLFALLWGVFGVHNFYLGHYWCGAIQLALTCLTCFYGMIITLPWALTEGILIFSGKIDKDAKGVPLKD